MTHILVITSRGPREGSHSGRLAHQAIEALRARFAGAEVTVRDLAQSPLPAANRFFVDDPVLGGRSRVGAPVVQSDQLIDELLAADLVVIAVPMIDFSIPASLKAWIDHVTRRGRTFHYADGLPHGLVTGKRAVIVRPKSPVVAGVKPGPDYQAPYLRQMLGFLGITDIEVMDVDSMAGAEIGEALAQDGAVWRNGGRAENLHASPSVGVADGLSRAGPDRHPREASRAVPSAKSTRLKAHWR
jgi:FMN-dependent NADH-azoreductase